jgi:hypothetical protein
MAPPFSVVVVGCAVDESNNRFERNFHLKTCSTCLFAARLDLRIICDCSSNGIGELASQPVDDVVHWFDPP